MSLKHRNSATVNSKISGTIYPPSPVLTSLALIDKPYSIVDPTLPDTQICYL
uniref:Uncharacterized protein n=1 Tax=Lepeophtheirus salmonis TaxID=72036 RepID=A0A0K2TJZ3_LEPSM